MSTAKFRRRVSFLAPANCAMPRGFGDQVEAGRLDRDTYKREVETAPQ